MEIRRLTERDAQAFFDLRLHALQTEPEAFAESPAEHKAKTAAHYIRSFRSTSPDNFVLGAFDEGTLIGTIGLYRETREKHRHKANIWGMYVAEPHRGTGIARALLETAIAAAKQIPGLRTLHLGVSVIQTAARRLYLSAGFQPYGLEPNSLHLPGRDIDEEHMHLDLD